MQKINFNNKNNGQVPSTSSGQVMMITVMVLSGVIIGAAAISGILTTRQTRQTVDAGNSSKAVFAADAGLEWRLYKFIKDDYECGEEDCSDGGQVCDQKPSFENSSEGDIDLATDCNHISSDAGYDYYRISSSATVKNSSSFTYTEDVRVIK